MKNFIAKYISTFFYLGYFPFAAGSLASFIGGFFAGILSFHPFVCLALIVTAVAAGFLAAGTMERISGKKDPPCIVIDEFAGALIAFFMLPLSWPVFWSTFFLFRAFDMFKIFPANILERRKGACGVMMDDIIAGVYTNLIMQMAVRIAGLI